MTNATTDNATTSTGIPGYVAGTWDIDQSHSDVSFSIRHMMISKVKGRFGKFAGQIVTADDPAASTANATIDMSSIDTNDAQRDGHLRSADFFDVEKYPTMTFNSTGVVATSDGYAIDGDLELHGVTRRLRLAVEVNGFGPDAFGGTRAGFSASTDISRKDFGIEFNMALEGGGVVVGDKIHVTLEIEAVLQVPPA